MINCILDILTQKDKELILDEKVLFNYLDHISVHDRSIFLLYVCYFFKT